MIFTIATFSLKSKNRNHNDLVRTYPLHLFLCNFGVCGSWTWAYLVHLFYSAFIADVLISVRATMHKLFHIEQFSIFIYSVRHLFPFRAFLSVSSIATICSSSPTVCVLHLK